MSPNFQRGACADYPAVIHKPGNRTRLRENGSGKHVCGRIRGPYLARHFGGMVLWATILFLQGAGFVGEFHSTHIYQEKKNYKHPVDTTSE